MPHLLTVAALFFLLVPLTPLHAEVSNPTTASIKGLTTAVNRLADALEMERRDAASKESLEKLNLAIAYLSFRSRRIEALEREINSMKNMRNNAEEVQKTWNERLAAFEERQRQSTGDEDEKVSQMIVDAKEQITLFKDRQARFSEEILLKENQVYQLQKEIGVIEQFVESHLEF